MIFCLCDGAHGWRIGINFLKQRSLYYCWGRSSIIKPDRQHYTCTNDYTLLIGNIHMAAYRADRRHQYISNIRYCTSKLFFMSDRGYLPYGSSFTSIINHYLPVLCGRSEVVWCRLYHDSTHNQCRYVDCNYRDDGIAFIILFLQRLLDDIITSKLFAINIDIQQNYGDDVQYNTSSIK